MAEQKAPTTTVSIRKSRAASRRQPNQRTVVIGFLVVCALALAVFVVRISARPPAPNAERSNVADAALVARGRQVYTTRCAACHGADLAGEPGWPKRRANGTLPAAPLDASGSAWQRDDEWLFAIIRGGGQATAAPGTISSMPAFGGGLTDADIWAVISYLKSTWPK